MVFVTSLVTRLFSYCFGNMDRYVKEYVLWLHTEYLNVASGASRCPKIVICKYFKKVLARLFLKLENTYSVIENYIGRRRQLDSVL